MTKVLNNLAPTFTGSPRATLDTKNVTGGETIPAAPSNHTATGISSSVIRSSWTDNADNETGTEVHGSDTENGAYTLLDTVAAGVTTFDEAGLSASQTRWHKSRAINTVGNSEFSNKDSGTTATAASAPGAPTNLLVVDNEDGTANISCTLADDTNTESEIQIWVQGTTSWDSILNLDSTPTVEIANNLAIPGASGAVVNGSNEFGSRWRVANETGSAFSAEFWAPVTNISATVTAGTMLANATDSTTINCKFSVVPTNETGVQLQRVLTSLEAGPENWVDVVGADTVAELTGVGWDDTVTTEVQYSYRIEVTDGVDTLYTPVVRETATATPAAIPFLDDDFESGSFASFWGTKVYCTISTDAAFSGTRSMQFRYLADPTPDDGSWAEARFDLGADYTELTITYDLLIPSNYVHRDPPSGPHNNKMLRLWAESYAAYNGYDEKIGLSLTKTSGSSPSISRIRSEYRGEPTWGMGAHATTDPFIVDADKGNWRQIKIYVKAPTDVSNAILKVYKDDVLMHSDTAIDNNHIAGTQGYRYGYLMGWANSGYAEETLFYIDNVKFYDSEV